MLHIYGKINEKNCLRHQRKRCLMTCIKVFSICNFLKTKVERIHEAANVNADCAAGLVTPTCHLTSSSSSSAANVLYLMGDPRLPRKEPTVPILWFSAREETGPSSPFSRVVNALESFNLK